MLISRLLQPKILLSLICIFFLFTRLYKITEIPPSVYWDEASIGYNAYSIAQTGKDEWGKVFPIHFRAFGEFKLPVYIYVVVPFVKAFGLNAFSVRLPAVLFSLGVMILTYLISKRLSGSIGVGLLSSFFVTISPWFFILSRVGYEATAGLMFYLLGILLFLHKPSGKLFLFSIASLILSAYSYNSFRIISPLTFLILIILKKDEIKGVFKKESIYIVIAGLLLFLSFIPIFRLYKYDAGGSRLQAVGATSAIFIKNYFSHFSPDFLILNGDKNLRSQQLGSGQLSLPELAFLLLGFLFIITSRKPRHLMAGDECLSDYSLPRDRWYNELRFSAVSCKLLKKTADFSPRKFIIRSRKKYYLLVLVLLLLGPIPAALTKESPHALRAISMVPFISIISAEGVSSLWRFVKNKYLLYFWVVAISLGFFLNYFLNFLNTYPVQSSKDWQYGYQQAVDSVNKKIFTGYDRVIISDEYAQPYIFVLFYLKIDPNKFRQDVVRNSVEEWGFSTVSSFDKFEFGKVAKLYNQGSKRTLIFASKDEKLATPAPVGMIKFLDGTTAFWIYKL